MPRGAYGGQRKHDLLYDTKKSDACGCLSSYATGRFERMRQNGSQWEYSRSPAAATASKVSWLPHTNDALGDSLRAGLHDLDKEDGLPLTAWHEFIVARGPLRLRKRVFAYGFWVRRRMRAIRISPLGAKAVAYYFLGCFTSSRSRDFSIQLSPEPAYETPVEDVLDHGTSYLPKSFGNVNGFASIRRPDSIGNSRVCQRCTCCLPPEEKVECRKQPKLLPLREFFTANWLSGSVFETSPCASQPYLKRDVERVIIMVEVDNNRNSSTKDVLICRCAWFSFNIARHRCQRLVHVGGEELPNMSLWLRCELLSPDFGLRVFGEARAFGDEVGLEWCDLPYGPEAMRLCLREVASAARSSDKKRTKYFRRFVAACSRDRALSDVLLGRLKRCSQPNLGEPLVLSEIVSVNRQWEPIR